MLTKGKIMAGLAALSIATSIGFYSMYSGSQPTCELEKETNISQHKAKCCQIPITKGEIREVKAVFASEKPAIPEKACVFKTIFNEEPSDGFHLYKTPQKVQVSIDNGLKWILKAQHSSGGWGAGLHSAQHIRDPHAVKTDPATTSMVAMALLRCENTLDEGPHAKALKKATLHLLEVVEKTPKKATFITDNRNTQIQTKLGQNIDAIITAQFLSNLLDKIDDSHKLRPRIQQCLDICVEKIQDSQNSNGASSNAGWAGVLQSSMANSALESAASNGAKVDQKKLDKAREYQESNLNVETGDAVTTDGAGIVLYSVSSTARGSAKKARKVREEVEKAKQAGKIEKSAPVSVETLKDMGYSDDEAMDMTTSYKVYETAKNKAQDKRVTTGFGNNGGEEFISFLQTGESMVVSDDNDWEKWYDDVSGKMLAIQNKDGSWNGHHCITSPVFCTATCLLILSINNDVDILSTMGEE